MSETQSRVARVSLALGGTGAALFVLGPLLIQVDALSSYAGFRFFMLGAMLGLIALLLGAIGLWQTRSASGRGGRSRAVAGAVLGAATTAIVLFTAGSARDLPPINDITTNPDDPPVFRAAGDLPANRDRDLAYPGEEFASRQRAAYPDLLPIRVEINPDEALGRARRVIRELGWELTGEDPSAGILEALDVTHVFRFVDDVVIRIRPSSGGAVVDLRSKSRDGRGDMGANATRIRAFRDAFTR